jgi:hypothetical protein
MRTSFALAGFLAWVLLAVPCGWAQDFTSNLLAYWPLNEGTGTTAVDVVGGVTLTFTAAPGAPTWLSGASCKIGAACLSFDGTNDSATFPTVTTGTTWTYAAWIWPQSGATGIDFGTLISDTIVAIYLRHNTGNVLDTYFTGTSHVSSSGLTFDQWNHVAVSVQAGALQYYINGTAAGTVSSVPALDPNILGDDRFNEWFWGRMDDVRLYTRALTQADVQALMLFTGASSRRRVSLY